MWSLIGSFLCYLVFIAALVGVRFWRDEVLARRKLRESWELMSEIEDQERGADKSHQPAS